MKKKVTLLSSSVNSIFYLEFISKIIMLFILVIENLKRDEFSRKGGDTSIPCKIDSLNLSFERHINFSVHKSFLFAKLKMSKRDASQEKRTFCLKKQSKLKETSFLLNVYRTHTKNIFSFPFRSIDLKLLQVF
jgi:hypothetical protein